MRNELERFNFATSGAYFIFNCSFYDKIVRVLIGSPLGPVIDNEFMRCHQNKWLEEFDKGKVLMYKHFVDDTFCTFEN